MNIDEKSSTTYHQINPAIHIKNNTSQSSVIYPPEYNAGGKSHLNISEYNLPC